MILINLNKLHFIRGVRGNSFYQIKRIKTVAIIIRIYVYLSNEPHINILKDKKHTHI